MEDARTLETEIFAEALRLPPAERAGYLTRLCGEDVILRQRIEELLKVQGRVGGFLETSNQESGFSIAGAVPEGEQGRVGRYRLIEKIGEGGCGVVYRAEQDEPVRREVALKIIKPGMDTKEVIARFEAERQALAMMDHPGIAKVLDAAQTESGRPYFVMELIRGTKITDYCDQQSLPTNERLKLLVQVCQAIQHAHQKGVIHRDIKPSNILVTTATDGALQPVVIDFGIAKATVGVHLTDKTIFTAVEMLVGTPTYMSPEQAAISSQDVDTRSDIYSLGVLLYELMTGTTPFNAGELLQLGIDEVRRAIREQEPLRPSVRLGKMTGETITGVAKHRQVVPPHLIRSVRGDLDCIAMKALEKDRDRRYETANGLALDICRYLANEPITARPASALYRFRKTAARNKLLFASMAVVFLLLITGLVLVSSTLAREQRALAAAQQNQERADAEKAAAVIAAETSEVTTKFLISMFNGIDPDTAKGHDTTILKKILDLAIPRLDVDLAKQPQARGRLYQAIGRVYNKLGPFDQALESLRKSAAAMSDGYGPDSAERVDALDLLAHTAILAGKFHEAEAAYLEAVAIQRGRFGDGKTPELAKALRALASVYWVTGRERETERNVREALEILRSTLGPKHKDTLVALYSLSIITHYRKEYADAEAMLKDVLAAWSQVDAKTLRIADCMSTLGTITSSAGRPSEGDIWRQKSIALTRELLGDENPRMAVEKKRGAITLIAQNRMADAERELLEAKTIQDRSPNLRVSCDILEYLSLSLEAQGRLQEAESVAREGWHWATSSTELPPSVPIAALNRLASVLASGGRFIEAQEVIAQALPGDPTVSDRDIGFAKVRRDLLARNGQWEAALGDAQFLVGRDPGKIEPYHSLAPLLAITAEHSQHETMAETLLREFGDTKTPLIASWIVADCLLLPRPAADTTRFASLAHTATNGSLEGDWAHYAEFSRALYEYRQGQSAEAISWAKKSSVTADPGIKVASHAVIAMAQQQQMAGASARQELDSARVLVERLLPQQGRNDLGPEWRNQVSGDTGSEWKSWIYAHVMMGEATALIQDAAIR